MNIYNEFERIVEHVGPRPSVTQSTFWGNKSLLFTQLHKRIENLASGLVEKGVKQGDKVLLFVKPSLEFPAIVFAVYKIGAIPVFIDPGMGKSNLLKCVKDVRPDILIAEPMAYLLKLIYPKSFRSVRKYFWTLDFNFLGIDSIRKTKSSNNVETYEASSDELAAILFTSGGTGAPKGVEYTHEIFIKQKDMLGDMFKLTTDDVDVAGFPLFSLFTLCLGMKSVVAKLNPSRPASVNPKKIVENIKENSATFVAGSPAIWDKVADYCIKNHIKLPSVQSVVMFGAPVNMKIHKKFQRILTTGSTYTPYGATEALPLTNISGKEFIEICGPTYGLGNGTCVGMATNEVEVKIISLTDKIIENLSDTEELAANEIGEIIVSGPTVTKRYHQNDKATKRSKIKDGDKIWHRMGDTGRIDEQGRLWFCGRKTHRIITKEETLFPVKIEEVFNTHPKVKRSAVVGVGIKGHQTPVLFVERTDNLTKLGKNDDRIFRKELKTLAKRSPDGQKIQSIIYHKSFPVDVRHNIKIDRLKLKSEAERICEF